MTRPADVVAQIEDVLIAGGYADRDWSVGPDAMRWSPAAPPATETMSFGEFGFERADPTPPPAEIPADIAETLRRMYTRTGTLTLRMLDGPQAGQLVTVPPPAPPAYRFAVMPTAFWLTADETPEPVLLNVDDYLWTGRIRYDGSLLYEYCNRS